MLRGAKHLMWVVRHRPAANVGPWGNTSVDSDAASLGAELEQPACVRVQGQTKSAASGTMPDADHGTRRIAHPRASDSGVCWSVSPFDAARAAQRYSCRIRCGSSLVEKALT